MSPSDDESPKAPLENVPVRKLSPEAERALAEAAERRAAADREEAQAKLREINGPKGPEPTRYGDWERKGIAVDF